MHPFARDPPTLNHTHPACACPMPLQALKYLINEKRPDHAYKKDPGMPSSHANSECLQITLPMPSWHSQLTSSSSSNADGSSNTRADALMPYPFLAWPTQ
jgi:hypothetical protein